MLKILTLLTITAGLAGSACAGVIGVNLVSPELAGLAGDTLTFQGTLSNSSGALQFINGAQLLLSGFSSNQLDSTDFLTYAPFTLANGVTTSQFPFFTVTIPTPFTAGPYEGAFSVLGGATGTAQNDLGDVSFTVQVGAVPEPSTAVLLALAAGCMGLLRVGARRRI
jgi:hypothetical protein